MLKAAVFLRSVSKLLVALFTTQPDNSLYHRLMLNRSCWLISNQLHLVKTI